MTALVCERCRGEGSLYTSRYGGNDPDVWRTGLCPACNGSGHAKCEGRGCSSVAVGFNDDGEALCSECLADWATEYAGDGT